MKIPLFETLRNHKTRFAFIYAGPVSSVLIASALYRPHLIYVVSLAFSFFVALFLIESLTKKVLIDNAGVASHSTEPVKYWVRVSLWSIAYVFAAFMPIGYAVQEVSR